MKPGGRKGESAGSEAGDKEKWPARPPGAQPAGEPGQDGRWGPEEGAQKPGDEIRAVFLRGTRGSRPWPGGGAERRQWRKKRGGSPVSKGVEGSRFSGDAQRPLRTARGAGAPLQVFWGEAKEPETPSHKPTKATSPPISDATTIANCEGRRRAPASLLGQGNKPRDAVAKTHKGSKPTKETTPQPTNLRKKEGKQQLPSVQ